MKIAKKYDIPDKCIENCEFKDSLYFHGQSSICTRCPIFCCWEPITEKEKNYLPLVPADEYRDDWAKEWDEYFKNGTIPRLMI